jgi:hypothetical protein
MLDSETSALKEQQRLQGLERQIADMLLDKSLDYRRICKGLDDNYRCKYSSTERLAIVQILCYIRQSGLADIDKKKLQKVINHYAIERENMIVLKP